MQGIGKEVFQMLPSESSTVLQTRGHFPHMSLFLRGRSWEERRPGPGQLGTDVIPHSGHPQFVISKRKTSGQNIFRFVLMDGINNSEGT